MKVKLLLLASVFFASILLGLTFGDPHNSGYVGSKECLLCHSDFHSEICKGWQTSLHHLGMKLVSGDENIQGNFKINPFFKKRDVRYIISNGDSRYVYIGADLQVLPLEWSQNDSVWIERKTVDASQRCFGCHTTGYFVSLKKFIEPGVGCEACHGPGSKHVESDGEEGTIVNPANLDPDHNRMVCGQCHSLGKDSSGLYPFPVVYAGVISLTGVKILKPFQPGEDLTLGFIDARPKIIERGQEYSLLVQAPEYYAKHICTDCHDPHDRTENLNMLIDATSGICLRCHESKIRDLAGHWGADRAPCWDCHKYAHTH